MTSFVQRNHFRQYKFKHKHEKTFVNLNIFLELKKIVEFLFFLFSQKTRLKIRKNIKNIFLNHKVPFRQFSTTLIFKTKFLF